jgi:hypothetical protein
MSKLNLAMVTPLGEPGRPNGIVAAASLDGAYIAGKRCIEQQACTASEHGMLMV